MVTVFDMSAGELVQVSVDETRASTLVPMVMPGCGNLEQRSKPEEAPMDYPQLALQLQEVGR